MLKSELNPIPPGSKPKSPLVGMKNWSDEKQSWHGVVCRVMEDASGKEFVAVFDIGSAATQVEIDDWIKESIRDKPWEKRGEAR